MVVMNAKNILVFCFDSLGGAYEAIQLASSDIDILEVFPLGAQGHVVFISEKPLDDLFKNIQSALKTKLIKANLIVNCPAKVLGAYLSVENAKINDNVAIVETTYIGDLMGAACEAMELGLDLMDLRMLRGASSSCFMFLTGEMTGLQMFSSSSRLKTTIVQNANEHIRALFTNQP